MQPVSIADYRALARRVLPPFLFEYIDGGSFQEGTLRDNITALAAIPLRQRVMRDVSAIDLSTELFGQRLAMPIALGPVGLAGMSARRGEVQAARAAERHGVPFTLSTVSVCPIGEVAAAVGRPIWFQLYMIRDRPLMRDLLAQAREARCSLLMFTVDMPVPGTRYRDYRSGLAGSPGLAGSLNRLRQACLHPRWAFDVGVMGRPHHLGNVVPALKGQTGLADFIGWMGANFDPTVTWRDLEWVRSEWDGPLVVKGIMDPVDAIHAADSGAEGVVVSNHGGRQLDGAPATAVALPAIVEAVGERVTVLADGGVRSGVDVLRMLALGAKGVLLGRAWAYAAAGGGRSIGHMLGLFEAEMRAAMALTGICRVQDIDRDMLARP